MKKLSEIALNECIVELRAACRLPIDPQALETMMSWVRPQFVQILDHPEGGKRWADHGQQMRDNGRYISAFADFFARHTDANTGVSRTVAQLDGLRLLLPQFEPFGNTNTSHLWFADPLPRSARAHARAVAFWEGWHDLFLVFA